MSIPFTQYLMPHGRKRDVCVLRSNHVERLAKEIIKLGYRFEVELLQNGMVSIEIMRESPNPDINDSLASAITENGPDLLKAIDEMVIYAAKQLKIQ